jgi:uncharacterized surface protein with fasciclin (FAS1) repeats
MKTLRGIIFLIPLLSIESIWAHQPTLSSYSKEDITIRGQSIQQAEKTIFETVTAHPELSTWVSMLTPIGLDTTLSNPQPFTVFVPTNQAFKKLTSGTMPHYFNANNLEKLATTLKYHIVPGRMRLEDLKDGQKLRALNGEELIVVKIGNTVRINGAKISQPDIEASNGVIHVTDEVLLPGTEAVGNK